jgi:hypothetical protein
MFLFTRYSNLEQANNMKGSRWYRKWLFPSNNGYFGWNYPFASVVFLGIDKGKILKHF